jgi:hypothetical protein
VIPKCPNNLLDPYHDDLAMWRALSERDLVFIDGQPGKAVLNKSLVDNVEAVVRRTRGRIPVFKTTFSDHPNVIRNLSSLTVTIQLCFDRLKTSPSPFRLVQQNWIELRRAWLSLVAIMDYMETFRPKMGQMESAPKLVENRIGAFVLTDEHAAMLFWAGLPVYYVRDEEQLPLVNILKIVSLTVPCPPDVCLAHANPPYPTIYTGSAASDDKFAHILANATTSASATLFSAAHYPGGYQSSWDLGSGPVGSAIESRPSTSSPVRTEHRAPPAPYPRRESKFQKPRKNRGQPNNRKSNFATLCAMMVLMAAGSPTSAA